MSSKASQLVFQAQSLINDEKPEHIRGNGNFVFEYDLRVKDNLVDEYQQATEFSHKLVKDATEKVFGDLYFAVHDFQVHSLPSKAV